MFAWRCWLTLVWMVLMTVAACRLTNGRPWRKLHSFIATVSWSSGELFIRHWRQAFNLESPNGNEWALQRMLDTISHTQVREGFACLTLTSRSPPPPPPSTSFHILLLLAAVTIPSLPIHTVELTLSFFLLKCLFSLDFPSVIAVFLGQIYGLSILCLPSRPALAIFVCCSSLQHLINSYSNPPSFTPFQEPHNKCREGGTDWGDLLWAYKGGLVK